MYVTDRILLKNLFELLRFMWIIMGLSYLDKISAMRISYSLTPRYFLWHYILSNIVSGYVLLEEGMLREHAIQFFVRLQIPENFHLENTSGM